MSDVLISNLVKTYPGNTERATDDISLEIADGEFMVLLGPSGCGKTTLLRMIAGLELPDDGSISIGSRDVTYLPAHKRGLSMVFQSYAVFPHRSVRDNIAFGLTMAKKDQAEVERKVEWAAELLQLGRYLDRKPAQLSGGQRQRVAVARAIVMDADVLLMDEPLSNLDALLRLEFRTELKKIVQDLGTTTIYVTHDQGEALSLGDRVAVMRAGRIVQLGDPIEVYDTPTDRFVGTRVNTVRIAPDQSPTIFRQTTPVTQFGVTGGIVRNDALPINRIQSRTRIERRNIDSSRTTPRPITGWTGGTARSTGQVSVIAPAPEVRQAIGSRPGRGRSSRGNAGNQGTEIRRQPPAQAQPNPGAPVYEDRNRNPGRGRHEAQPQPAPRVERQPVVAPVQPQPQSNPNEYRGRGRGRGEGQQTQQAPPQAPPPQVQRQQPPPQAQPNPGNVEKPGKGHGQENRGKPSKEQRGQGKAKGKDKDKPE